MKWRAALYCLVHGRHFYGEVDWISRGGAKYIAQTCVQCGHRRRMRLARLGAASRRRQADGRN